MPVKSVQPCCTEIQQDRIPGPECCFPIACTCLGINLGAQVGSSTLHGRGTEFPGLGSVRAPCADRAALTGEAAVKTKGPGEPSAEEVPAGTVPAGTAPAGASPAGSWPEPTGRRSPGRARPRSRGRSLGPGGVNRVPRLFFYEWRSDSALCPDWLRRTRRAARAGRGRAKRGAAACGPASGGAAAAPQDANGRG